MRRVDFEKKRPARWPWVIGLLALAAAGWGITTLLAPPPEPAPVAVDSTAADTLPPAVVPAPPDAPDPGSTDPQPRN